MISCAIIMLSVICRLAMKADCIGEVSLGRSGLRRFARILDIILYETLHRLIVQNEQVVWGSVFLV